MRDFLVNKRHAFCQENSLCVEYAFNSIDLVPSVKILESKNLWSMDFCQISWKVYKYLRLNGDFHARNGSRVNKETDYTSHSENSSISIDQNSFMGEERNCGALLVVLNLSVLLCS